MAKNSEKTPEQKAAEEEQKRAKAEEKKQAAAEKLQDAQSKGATDEHLFAEAAKLLPDQYVTDAQMERDSQDARATIDKEEKIPTIIEDDGTHKITITVNGTSFEYDRGRLVWIPKSHIFMLRSIAKCKHENAMLAKGYENREVKH